MKDQNQRNGPKHTERRAYAPPTVTAYGEVREITAGMATGTALDETFPTGTPFDDLTFS